MRHLYLSRGYALCHGLGRRPPPGAGESARALVSPTSLGPGLYAHLGVKRWKHRVPSYKPYDMHGDLQAVVMQMCRNELAHEVMAALSFVPLLFCLFCDDPVANLPVFLITSVLAAVADLIPVILQRYNRPRLQRLLRRREQRAERK